MERSGDPMDVDTSSFNARLNTSSFAGRRRTFDEFARDEQVQMDRDHQPLAQMPDTTDRRPHHFRIPVPTDPPVRLFRGPEGPRRLLPHERPLAWREVVYNTVFIGPLIVAILTADMCRQLIVRAAGAGRDVYVNRDQIRHTCTAVVQSRYNAAKRRLVTITGSVSTFTRYRRRLPPSPSSPRPSSPRSSNGITSTKPELSIRDQYLEMLRMEGVEFTGPVTFPEVIDANSTQTLPYMMTGALLSSPGPNPHGLPLHAPSFISESEPAMEVDDDDGDEDDSDESTMVVDEEDYDESAMVDVEEDYDESAMVADEEDSDESVMVGDEDETCSDTSSDTSTPAFGFADTIISDPVNTELDKIHGNVTESISDTTETSSEPIVSQSSPKASNPSSQKYASLSSSLRIAASSMRPGAQQNFSSPALPSDPSKVKQSPKKTVAFFESPKTGKPISKTKKFILGEPMDFPVSSSPVPDESTLSSIDSILLDDSLIHDGRSLKRPDTNSGVDLHQQAGPELEYRERFQPSPLTVEANGSSLRVEASFSASASASLKTGDSLPVVEGEVSLVDGADAASDEEVSRGGTPAESSEEVAATEADTQAQAASESDGNSPNLAGSESSPRKGRSSRRSQSPSSRRSELSPRTSRRLAFTLEALKLGSRRGSLRIAEKLEKALREEQAAVEAAEKLRKEKEAEEEAARKAKEAEEAARREREAEEERRKQGVRRIPKEKIIQPLDAKWEADVQQALDTPNMRQVLVNLPTGATLTRKDIGTLKVVPGRDPAHGWLNDEIIATCLQQVVDYGLKMSGHKAGETPKYHAFNTFFYKNLRDKGAQSIKRWASKAKIGKEDLLKVERVFIPVHQGAHWTLLVVSPLTRTIEYFDSMGGRAGSYVQNAKLWLAEELGRGWKEEEWTVPTGSYGAGPRQTNGSDCGVFTCTTARMVVLGVDPMSYGGDDMEVQRGRMVAELLNGGLEGDFEPRVVF